jgi:aspartokinase/homoserine dehydrogenase 1
VVSCTLNYVITGYDGVRRESFATLLRRAQAEGLTEQDPRTDLGGRDALRKLLILSREAGVPLEEKDVKVTPMLGPEYFEGSVEDFYRLLDANEAKFVKREDELDAIGMRQRFVASLRRDGSGYKAEIKMQLVGIDSPFYWISGTENVTVIHSGDAYPLVIKGSGEGAHLAASGIIRNILQ